MMDDLLERYLGAVCSYFITPSRKHVYKDLKKQIQSSMYQYESLEDLLISYGHPRSVALGYGYRPITQHIFNKQIVDLVEKTVFAISGIYLFFSTLYYLQQLNCLPFQQTKHVVAAIDSSNLITWLLSHPIFVLTTFALTSLLILILLEHKYKVPQELVLPWTKEDLYALPHQSNYPKHTVETILMIIFSIFFLSYHAFFAREVIYQIQHESYQMIHIMTYFFQPFMMIIYFNYVMDMSRKMYSRKYLKFSSLIDLFIIISLSIFIINSKLLKDYLLPFQDINYIFIDIFIIGALIMIYTIASYKLLCNLKAYKYLFESKKQDKLK